MQEICNSINVNIKVYLVFMLIYISKIQRKNGQKGEICYKRGERSAGKELGELDTKSQTKKEQQRHQE